jgi:hypothetical protein
MNLYSPNGAVIKGTSERVYGTARVIGFTYDRKRKCYEPDYEGGTDIYWDSQETILKNGKRIFIDANGDSWTEDQCTPRKPRGKKAKVTP